MNNKANMISLRTLAILAIIVFYILVLIFSVNIPQQDDYDSILIYLLGSQDLFSDGLFDVHVSHRLVLTRLLAKLSLIFGHGLELRLPIYIGALSLLGVVFVVYRTTEKLANRELIFYILCVSVFSLFHWSNMAWATASVQNYIALCVIAFCFYLFDKQTGASLTGAVILGLIAPYINSNGLLVLPVLLVWTLASLDIETRKGTFLSIAVASVISFYLFFGFFEGQISTPISDPSSMVFSIFPNLLSLINAYLISTAGYLHFEPLAWVAGLVVNLYFLLLIRFRYDQKNRIVFYIYLYLLLSIALVALFRQEFGIRQLIASRYQIYTIMINALVAISFFELDLTRYIKFRYIKQLAAVSFSLLYLASFYYLGNLSSEKSKIEQGLRDWQRMESASLYYPDPLRAGQILNQAIETGIYQVP